MLSELLNESAPERQHVMITVPLRVSDYLVLHTWLAIRHFPRSIGNALIGAIAVFFLIVLWTGHVHQLWDIWPRITEYLPPIVLLEFLGAYGSAVILILFLPYLRLVFLWLRGRLPRAMLISLTSEFLSVSSDKTQTKTPWSKFAAVSNRPDALYFKHKNGGAIRLPKRSLTYDQVEQAREIAERGMIAAIEP